MLGGGGGLDLGVGWGFEGRVGSRRAGFEGGAESKVLSALDAPELGFDGADGRG
jgi:hypothetical protein